MLADGMSASAADAMSSELASQLTPANFACVPDPSEGSDGLCKYHPDFHRVNVLPDGFELVVAESDEPADNDARILAWLAPEAHAECVNLDRSTPVENRSLYRLDGDVWFIK